MIYRKYDLKENFFLINLLFFNKRYTKLITNYKTCKYYYIENI